MEKSFRRATAFISSTFADMTDERNLITYNVLPRIKKWAFDRGIIFDVVDLRWGINDEQAKDLHHTIKLCLQNVKDSEPIFVCLLGERYGWIPPVEDFNQSMFKNNIDKYKNLSATELEIAEALDGAFLNSPPKSCLFLLRNSLDFDGIPSDVKGIYKEESNASLLQKLKDSLLARNDISKHFYSATFSMKDGAYSLCDFVEDKTPLENIIFDELKKILIEKYGISNERATIFDDILTRQQYHKKELLLYPKIKHHQDEINEFLHATPEHGYTPIGTPHNSAIFSQIAHFVEEQSTLENQRVICRFWGLNVQIDNINDLICSIAYEFSNDKSHLGNPIRSLIFLKNHLETITQNTLLVIAGMPYNLLPDYFNIFLGLKWTKQLVFYDIGNFTQTDLTIDFDNESFKSLAKFMFERRAKSLTQTQLNSVLQAAKTDYSTLKIIIDYLCNFARYETLDNTINSLASLDNLAVAKLYLKSIINVQNFHDVKGVMRDVIDILCNSPLPLSKVDIVDTICLARNISKPFGKAQIDKEVAFSLRFASSLIYEYNSRFKIHDELIKTIVMFNECEPPYNFIPKESRLILALRSVYLDRLINDGSFSNDDAQNLLEIIKDYSDSALKQLFVEKVFKDKRVFYKLAKALDKKRLVDFFKTLTMQSLGQDVDSYFAREINRVLGGDGDKIGYANAIMQGKIFSLAKTLHKDNIFMKYYLAVQNINDDDLSSAEKFAQSLNKDSGCHKLSLPKSIDVSKNNTCAYTVFDANQKEYANYVCFCQDGFLIVCDIYIGEMISAYAIPRDLGEIVSVFYQNHTVHIVFEKGLLYTVHLWSKNTNIYRILPENMVVNQFVNYFSKGLQVAVADDRRIVLYNGGRIVNDIAFSPSFRMLYAYGINAKNNEFPRVCAIAQDSYGLTYVYSVDMHTHKIADQHVFIEKDVALCVQDENADNVYITLDDGTSYVVTFDDDGMLDVRDVDEKCHFSLKGNYAITQVGEQIKYNGKTIAIDKDVKCCFSARDMIVAITTDNTLHVIDNGY